MDLQQRERFVVLQVDGSREVVLNDGDRSSFNLKSIEIMSNVKSETKQPKTTKAAPASAPSSDRELVITRVIDASREKVFKTWTEPELLKQWFAPRP